MKYLVTGVTGQLGADVAEELLGRGVVVFGTGRKSSPPQSLFGRINFSYTPLELTDETGLKKCFEKAAPDVVIHCASWTAVDDAEKEENREEVRKVNVESTRVLAKLCGDKQVKLLYISTDYVFGGDADEPYSADCTDFAPLNVYGATKLEGESVVREFLTKYFVVRVAWTFGRYGNNFVEKMLRAAAGRTSVSVVDDQFGTPTYTRDAAKLIADIAASEKYGTYNLTASGEFVSRAGFAEEIFRAEGMSVKVEPVKTSDFKSLAKRPLSSRLDTSKLVKNGFEELPDWKDGLKRYLGERKNYI
ncbi:MAG: dTDP-4-dehydrorhamnose reductase [Lachnospiraceae bacterium]|nr:dTDP-4-dehydrorhamnose reductase [Lachnospiraceae bacterium]